MLENFWWPAEVQYSQSAFSSSHIFVAVAMDLVVVLVITVWLLAMQDGIAYHLSHSIVFHPCQFLQDERGTVAAPGQRGSQQKILQHGVVIGCRFNKYPCGW